MAVKYFFIAEENDISKLIQSMNKQLRDISDVLGRIQGSDGLTFIMQGIIEHKGDKVGLFSATPVVQQEHIVDAVIAHGAATTTELNALGVKINEILVLLETYGLTKTS